MIPSVLIVSYHSKNRNIILDVVAIVHIMIKFRGEYLNRGSLWMMETIGQPFIQRKKKKASVCLTDGDLCLLE